MCVRRSSSSASRSLRGAPLIAANDPSRAWAAGVGLVRGSRRRVQTKCGALFPRDPVLDVALSRSRSRALPGSPGAPGVIAVIASVVAPALTVLWLWRLDLLGDARVAVLEFNRFYVSQGLTLKGYAIDFSKAIWLRMKTDPLWLAGGVGSLVVALGARQEATT